MLSPGARTRVRILSSAVAWKRKFRTRPPPQRGCRNDCFQLPSVGWPSWAKLTGCSTRIEALAVDRAGQPLVTSAGSAARALAIVAW